MINKKFNFILDNINKNNIVVINWQVLPDLLTMETEKKNITKKENELLEAFTNGLNNFMKENKEKKYTYIIIYKNIDNQFCCDYSNEYTTDNFTLIKKIVNKNKKIKVYKLFT